MNKRIVSIFLCLALTIIPVVSLSATETEGGSDSKSTVTVTPETEPTETPTPTPTTEPSDTSKSNRSRSDEKETPSPKEETGEEDNSSSSSKEELTVTPTPIPTPSTTPVAEPTETPTLAPNETETPNTTPVEDLEDDENIPSAKSKLREPVRAPGDTTSEEFYDLVVEADDKPMYVCSNQSKIFGAAVVLYNGLLRSFAEKIGSNYYILPSSTHEMLFVPATDDMDPTVLSQMVHEVNNTEVSQQDFLSDSIYYYDYSEDTVKTIR